MLRGQAPRLYLSSPSRQMPHISFETFTGQSGCPLVSSDELIGDVVQVTAHYLRLRPDPKKIVADTLDQRCLPACGDGAQGVPRVAGDEAELRRPNSKLFLDIGVSLSRRLMVLHAVRTESSF